VKSLQAYFLSFSLIGEIFLLMHYCIMSKEINLILFYSMRTRFVRIHSGIVYINNFLFNTTSAKKQTSILLRENVDSSSAISLNVVLPMTICLL